MTTAIGPSPARLPTSSPATTKTRNTQSKAVKYTNQYKILWTYLDRMTWISIAGQATRFVQVNDSIYE